MPQRTEISTISLNIMKLFGLSAASATISLLLGTSPAQAVLLYSQDFSDKNPDGGFFATGVSGGLSGGVNGTVTFPTQLPGAEFTGPIVDTSVTFENDADGATFMQDFFYLGGGTKDNVQPATSGGGPQDPVVLLLNGISGYAQLDIEFDVESLGSWDSNDFFAVAVPTTGDVLFNGTLGRNLGQMFSVTLKLDPSIDSVEVVWTNTNSGRDEFFGIDNIQVKGVPVPEPSTTLGFGTLALGVSTLLKRRQRKIPKR